MALTTHQIEGLIKHVGTDLAPLDLDRRKLKQDVEWAGTRYRSRRLSGSTATANKRRKWLNWTKSITAKLQTALKDEENARWFNIAAPATLSTEECISFTGLLAALDGLHGEITKQLSGRPLNAFELTRSPFEYLAGELMPTIFSRHFRRTIGISRSADNGKPQGPLFRFVRAGVDLLGITNNGKRYKDEAIARAIRDTKTRPSRRKHPRPGQKS
jgi:hypothetical protein